MPRSKASPSPIPALADVEDIAPALTDARVKLAAGLQKASAKELSDRLREHIGLYTDPPGSKPSGLSLMTKRKIRFLIHEEFARRGIAPIWRRDAQVQFKPKGTPPTTEEQRHRCDSQIIDLMWIHQTRPGHRINAGVIREFEDLFVPGEFSYRQAERFATSTLLYPRKVFGLNLPVLAEAQLMALRSEPVRRKLSDIQNDGHDVRRELERVLDGNAHRLKGRKLEDVAREMTITWISYALASGQGTVAARIQQAITGETLLRSQMKSRYDSLCNALTEEKSKHIEAIKPLPKGEQPWHRTVPRPDLT